MGWNAKLTYGYNVGSDEWNENALLMAKYFKSQGFCDEATAAIIGNSNGESSLNPWNWQNQTYSPTLGYGLFQFTPSSYSAGTDGYIGHPTCSALSSYGPNLSPQQQTAGAKPEDGLAQCITLANDYLNKWIKQIWRDYWSSSTYTYAFSVYQNLITNYGSGGYVTMEQFKQVDDLEMATMAFLGGYEGPSSPAGLTSRYNVAQTALTIVQSVKTIPIWLLFKIKEEGEQCPTI